MASCAILAASQHSINFPRWKLHPTLAANPIRLEIAQNTVNVIPLIEQQPPVDGEVHPTLLDAFDRLWNYSLWIRYQVVTAGGDEAYGRVRYTCLHNSKRTFTCWCQYTNWPLHGLAKSLRVLHRWGTPKADYFKENKASMFSHSKSSGHWAQRYEASKLPAGNDSSCGTRDWTENSTFGRSGLVSPICNSWYNTISYYQTCKR